MEENNPIIEFVGTYVGKELRREYPLKDKVTKQPLLDANGKQMMGKVFGLKVKKNPQDIYPRSFTIFSTTKGFNTITEGDMVKLGYVEKDFVNKDGVQCKSYNVLWIGKTDDVPVQAEKDDNIVEQIVEFEESYFEMVQAHNEQQTKEGKPLLVPNACHMLGTFMLSTRPETYESLVKLFKEIMVRRGFE